MTESEAVRVSPRVLELISSFADQGTTGRRAGLAVSYDRAVQALTTTGPFSTRIGGYPGWMHDEPFGEESPFVLQIGHEPAAELCFGDAGVLRVHRVGPGEFEHAIETH